MMKKIFLLVTLLFFLQGLKAQKPCVTVEVKDTLHYYYNKHHFRAGYTPSESATYYKSAASTVTSVTHVGSKFENPDTVTVYGLEGVFSKHDRSASQIYAISIRLYLCKLDNNGKPILPAVDSVKIDVGSKVVSAQGANFTDTVGHKIVGDFAVCIRNISTIAGDTLRIYRTACKTTTAWPNVPWQIKYSDGYGFVRYYNQFYSTTNFTLAPGFGLGTDYEFCVAPRLKYKLTMCQEVPPAVANSETLCTHQQLVFKNLSSKHVTHRMYNLNEFYRKWNQPYAPFVTAPSSGSWAADSSVTWKFDFEDDGSAYSGKLSLPYGGGSNSITFQTDSVLPPPSICSNTNYFWVSLIGMNLFGNGKKINFSDTINMCVDYCNGDAVGLRNVKKSRNLLVYPNPVVDKVNILGIEGKNTVAVYDMLGQLVYKQVYESSSIKLDLSSLQGGCYMLRLVGESQQEKSIRLVKQ